MSVYLFKQACSAIYLAARDFGIQLPTSSTATNNTSSSKSKSSSSSLSWWEVFLGPNKTQELITCCNAIAGLCHYSNEYKYRQVHSKQGDGDDDEKDHHHKQEATVSAAAAALSSLSIDMLSANYGFITSLVIPKKSTNNSSSGDDDHFHGGPNGGSSFNDPDSFIWDHQKDLIVSSLSTMATTMTTSTTTNP